MLEGLGLCLLASHSCVDLLDDVIVWTALSICRMCPPEVVKTSFLKH